LRPAFAADARADFSAAFPAALAFRTPRFMAAFALTVARFLVALLGSSASFALLAFPAIVPRVDPIDSATTTSTSPE
jgi:hypothetical protein